MSESSNICPKAVLASLKCLRCKQYLSVPPIRHDSNGYYCGRCPELGTSKQWSHVEIYEKLATTLQFPCRYDSLGCPKRLKFGNTVENHEKSCNFKPKKCPAKSCNVEIVPSQLLQHCLLHHQGIVIPTNTFDIAPQPRTVVERKLLVLNRNVFILEVYHTGGSQKFQVDLKYFDPSTLDSVQATHFLLEVKANNTNSLVLSHQSIKEYQPNEDFSMQDNPLNLEIIRSLLQSENFKFEVKLVVDQTKDKPSDKNKVLSEQLECLVCGNYMIPPILICSTGHSICSTCKGRLRECPTCRASYGGARNFALEQLTEHFDYPCTNQEKGCTFVGKAGNIRTHESACVVKTFGCPLQSRVGCMWKGFLRDVYTHVKSTHGIYCLQTQSAKTIDRKIMVPHIELYYIITYDDRIFTLRVKDVVDGVCWTVDDFELAFGETSKYQFVVSFIIPLKSKFLIVGEMCAGGQNRGEHYGSNAIKLQNAVLEPFLNNGNLTFSVTIKSKSTVEQY